MYQSSMVMEATDTATPTPVPIFALIVSPVDGGELVLIGVDGILAEIVAVAEASTSEGAEASAGEVIEASGGELPDRAAVLRTADRYWPSVGMV